MKTRSVRSQRGKIGKKKGNTESSLRGYRVKTRQASEERENLLWNHAVTNPAQRRITELYPLLPLNPRWHGAQPESPHRWRQPRYTVSTRCPVYSSVRVSRGRKRNTEFEEGYRRRRKMEGDKPLGTRRVQTVSSSSSSSREIPKKLSLGACWLVARSWPTESRVGMIFPNLRKVDRLISRKGIGDDCRAVLHELVK